MPDAARYQLMEQENTRFLVKYLAPGYVCYELIFENNQPVGKPIQTRDHGDGFDVDTMLLNKTITGLRGMRERERHLGGKLVIKSTPGKGTTLSGRLPVITKGQRL